MTTSAWLMSFLRSLSSLRKSGSMEIISKSDRFPSLSRTCNPVVPASPSIKTLGLLANKEEDEDEAPTPPDLLGAVVEGTTTKAVAVAVAVAWSETTTAKSAAAILRVADVFLVIAYRKKARIRIIIMVTGRWLGWLRR